MSIFKDTFKPGVKAQILARQNAIVNRTPAAIQYLNSRNAWIRMCSSVNVGNDAGALAKSYVLLGGTLYNNKLRSGVGTGNQAYSTRTPGDTANNRLGIRPMPGIVDIDVKSKSAYGSLREVIVNFQCWDIKQLEDLELLYMRPGYSVLVEWGWAPYLTNAGDLQSNVGFVEDVLDGTLSKEDIWKKIFTKASTDGNYDGLYGFIKNYSWSARPDGGYDCTVTVISMGEILESLKVNYGPFTSKVTTNGVFGLLDKPFEEDSNITKAYSQNIIAGICNELYLIADGKLSISDYGEGVITDGGKAYSLFRFDVDIEGSENDTADNDFDNNNQYYIRLRHFIDILNKYVLVKDIKSGTPLVRVSVDEGDHMGGEDKPLLCLAHPLQLSIDPSVCLIKNEAWVTPSSLGLDEGAFDDFSTLKNIMKGIPKNSNYWYNDDYTTTQLGVIGNIYVNLGYLYSLAINNNLSSQDKKEKNDIAIFDYLKSMMAGINTAIGNVATFDIFSDPVDSVARIIDINYTDEKNRGKVYDEAFIIQMGNTNSTVRNYSLASQIFPEQSSIIAIGAQAEGGVLGSDTNTLVDFNQNLIDRVIPKKDAPTSPTNTNLADELKEKLENLKTNIEIIIDFINKIDADWWGFGIGQGDFDVNDSSKYANALKDIIAFYRTYVENDTKNRAIIPTKLSIEMDGIGGMVIGNLFRIPDDILPRGYKGGGAGPSKIGYLVTGLGHSIQNNDWITKVDAQFVILDEPESQLSITDVAAIKTVNKAAKKADKETAKKALDKAKGKGGGGGGGGGDKPRKSLNCDKSVYVVNQSNSPGLTIPPRTPWTTIKTQFPIVNGPIKVLSVGTPYDTGNDFAFKQTVSGHSAPLPNKKIDYIVLHYTVSSLSDPLFHFKSTWNNPKLDDKKKASADFTIGTTGRIAGFKNFQNIRTFHYGNPSWGGSANSNSIGIEIESFGWLKYCITSNKFVNAYDKEVNLSEVALTNTYRTHNIWQAHTDVQVSAIANLIIALYNMGVISDKAQFLKGTVAKGRYDILFPETPLTTKPSPGIITHGTGQPITKKTDTFPQKNLLDMLDDLPTLIAQNKKTTINWATS
jgi:hypothetical protein